MRRIPFLLIGIIILVYSGCMTTDILVRHDTMKDHYVISQKFTIPPVERRYSTATVELLKFEKQGKLSDTIMKIKISTSSYGFNRNFSSSHFGEEALLKIGKRTMPAQVYNRSTEKILYRDNPYFLSMNPGLNTNDLSGTIVLNRRAARRIRRARRFTIRLYDGNQSVTLRFYKADYLLLKKFLRYETDPRRKYRSLQESY